MFVCRLIYWVGINLSDCSNFLHGEELIFADFFWIGKNFIYDLVCNHQPLCKQLIREGKMGNVMGSVCFGG